MQLKLADRTIGRAIDLLTSQFTKADIGKRENFRDSQNPKAEGAVKII